MGKKGCLFLVIGLVLGLGSFILFFVVSYRAEKNAVLESIQLNKAGEHKVTLEKGTYTFFIEHLEDPELSIESTDFTVENHNSEPLAVSPHSGTTFSLIQGREGESTALFMVETPGEYTITIKNVPGKCTVALLKDYDERCRKAITQGCLYFFGGGCAGIILIIVSIVFFVTGIIQWAQTRKQHA